MEFPLMLFKGGELTADYRIVPDKAGEDAAAEVGFIRHGAKAKIQKAPEQLPADAAGDDSTVESSASAAPDKAALLKRAQELGVAAKGTWGVLKLQTEIAKAEGAQ